MLQPSEINQPGGFLYGSGSNGEGVKIRLESTLKIPITDSFRHQGPYLHAVIDFSTKYQTQVAFPHAGMAFVIRPTTTVTDFNELFKRNYKQFEEFNEDPIPPIMSIDANKNLSVRLGGMSMLGNGIPPFIEKLKWHRVPGFVRIDRQSDGHNALVVPVQRWSTIEEVTKEIEEL